MDSLLSMPSNDTTAAQQFYAPSLVCTDGNSPLSAELKSVGFAKEMKDSVGTSEMLVQKPNECSSQEEHSAPKVSGEMGKIDASEDRENHETKASLTSDRLSENVAEGVFAVNGSDKSDEGANIPGADESEKKEEITVSGGTENMIEGNPIRTDFKDNKTGEVSEKNPLSQTGNTSSENHIINESVKKGTESRLLEESDIIETCEPVNDKCSPMGNNTENREHTETYQVTCDTEKSDISENRSEETASQGVVGNNQYIAEEADDKKSENAKQLGEGTDASIGHISTSRTESKKIDAKEQSSETEEKAVSECVPNNGTSHSQGAQDDNESLSAPQGSAVEPSTAPAQQGTPDEKAVKSNVSLSNLSAATGQANDVNVSAEKDDSDVTNEHDDSQLLSDRTLESLDESQALSIFNVVNEPESSPPETEANVPDAVMSTSPDTVTAPSNSDDKEKSSENKQTTSDVNIIGAEETSTDACDESVQNVSSAKSALSGERRESKSETPSTATVAVDLSSEDVVPELPRLPMETTFLPSEGPDAVNKTPANNPTEEFIEAASKVINVVIDHTFNATKSKGCLKVKLTQDKDDHVIIEEGSGDHGSSRKSSTGNENGEMDLMISSVVSLHETQKSGKTNLAPASKGKPVSIKNNKAGKNTPNYAFNEMTQRLAKNATSTQISTESNKKIHGSKLDNVNWPLDLSAEGIADLDVPALSPRSLTNSSRASSPGVGSVKSTSPSAQVPAKTARVNKRKRKDPMRSQKYKDSNANLASSSGSPLEEMQEITPDVIVEKVIMGDGDRIAIKQEKDDTVINQANNLPAFTMPSSGHAFNNFSQHPPVNFDAFRPRGVDFPNRFNRPQLHVIEPEEPMGQPRPFGMPPIAFQPPQQQNLRLLSPQFLTNNSFANQPMNPRAMFLESQYNRHRLPYNDNSQPYGNTRANVMFGNTRHSLGIPPERRQIFPLGRPQRPPQQQINIPPSLLEAVGFNSYPRHVTQPPTHQQLNMPLPQPMNIIPHTVNNMNSFSQPSFASDFVPVAGGPRPFIAPPLSLTSMGVNNMSNPRPITILPSMANNSQMQANTSLMSQLQSLNASIPISTIAPGVIQINRSPSLNSANSTPGFNSIGDNLPVLDRQGFSRPALSPPTNTNEFAPAINASSVVTTQSTVIGNSPVVQATEQQKSNAPQTVASVASSPAVSSSRSTPSSSEPTITSSSTSFFSDVIELGDKMVSSDVLKKKYASHKAPKLSSQGSSIKLHKCLGCGDEFLFNTSLKDHTSRKSMKIQYKCLECKKVIHFWNRCTLFAHAKGHARGAKAYRLNINNAIISVLPDSEMLGRIWTKKRSKKSRSLHKDVESPTTDAEVSAITQKANEVTRTSTSRNSSSKKNDKHGSIESPIEIPDSPGRNTKESSNNKDTTVSQISKVTGKCHCARSERYKSRLMLNGKQRFECTECDMNFPTSADLIEHFTKPEGDTAMLVKCKECNRDIRGKCAASAHQRIHSKKRPYVCPDCAEVIEGPWKVFEKHLDQRCMHWQRSLLMRCSICNIVILFDSNTVTSHYVEHHSTKYYKCTQCPMAFKTEASFNQHFDGVHPRMKRCCTTICKCALCDTVFQPWNAMLAHFEKQHFAQLGSVACFVAFKCMTCNPQKLFNSQKTYALHVKQAHKGEAIDLMCNWCGEDQNSKMPDEVNTLDIVKDKDGGVLNAALSPTNAASRSEKSQNAVASKPTLTIYKCTRCNTIMKNKELFEKHLGEHGLTREKSPLRSDVIARQNSSEVKKPSVLSVVKDNQSINLKITNIPILPKSPPLAKFILTNEVDSKSENRDKKLDTENRSKKRKPDDSVEKDSSSGKSKKRKMLQGLDLKQPIVKVRKEFIGQVPTAPAPKARFSCSECNERFPAQHLLRMHLQQVHNQIPQFPCHLCGNTYDSSVAKFRHIQTVHEGKGKDIMPYWCWICLDSNMNRGFPSWKQLEKHLTGHHKLHKNNIDYSKFSKYSNPGAQNGASEAEEDKKEESGSTPAPEGAEVPEHQDQPVKRLKTSDDKTFTCAKCSFTAEDRSKFAQHIVKHKTDDSELQCQECGLCFTVLPALKRHLFMVHKVRELTKYRQETGVDVDREEAMALLNSSTMFNSSTGSPFKSQIPNGIKQPNISKKEPAKKRVRREEPEAVSTDPLVTLECNVCYKSFDDAVSLRKHMRGHGMAFIRSRRTAVQPETMSTK